MVRNSVPYYFSEHSQEGYLAVNVRVRFNNLPAWLTQLVGREREMQAACNLLESSKVRLL